MLATIRVGVVVGPLTSHPLAWLDHKNDSWKDIRVSSGTNWSHCHSRGSNNDCPGIPISQPEASQWEINMASWKSNAHLAVGAMAIVHVSLVGHLG